MVRVGFIGVGNINGVHLTRLAKMRDVEMVAFCDLIEEKAQRRATEYGGVVYTDFRRMLKHEKLDAAFIMVEPYNHPHIESYVARQGIHFFVEKPIGLDYPKVKRAAKIIAESGVMGAAGYVSCVRCLCCVAARAHGLASCAAGLCCMRGALHAPCRA